MTPAIPHSISIVVVSYNVRYFLEQALRSVRRAAAGLDVEVFVVDNASTDGSARLVREQFPEVVLMENRENTGFSRANNQAIRESRGEFVLLLNPDTLVEEDTFRKCLFFMKNTPRAGGLGVRMLDGGGRFLPESKRGFPSPWVAFCKTFGLASLFPRSKTFNFYHLGHLSEHENHEVDVLSGAFMFLRRAALDAVGLLDEAFFMYGEDIDLSYRLQLGGWTNHYLADAQIIHYKGESTKKGSLNYVRVFYRAMIIFAQKHFHGGAAGAYVAGLEAAIWLRAGLTIGRNFLKKAVLPMLDAALIAAGLWLLKDGWAVGYFNDPGHFTPVFWRVNVPLYLVFWLGGIFLSGGYDEKYDLRRLLRGLAVGTLGALAVYGMLNLEFRSSRILLLLGAVWAVAATVGLRAALHFFEFKNFRVGRSRVKNLVVVGSSDEAARAKNLMTEAGVPVNFIGVVGPLASETRDKSAPVGDGRELLGSLADLPEILRIYRATEVVFCSKDVSSQEIIGWMGRLPATVEVKILPEAGLSIIGSHSKNTAGELYTIDVRFALASPLARRNKLLNDWAICLAAACFSPILLFLKKGRRLLSGIFPVLFLKKTWVGYSDPGAAAGSLPRLRPGVFSPLDGLGLVGPAGAVRQRLDFFYAKDWSAGRDWEAVARGLFG